MDRPGWQVFEHIQDSRRVSAILYRYPRFFPRMSSLAFDRHARSRMDRFRRGDLHHQPASREERKLHEIAREFRLDDPAGRESGRLRIHSHWRQTLAENSEQPWGKSGRQSVVIENP